MTDTTTPDPLDGAFTADWLMRQQFPPTEYVVPGIIPEGLTLLAAPPKAGKSWMVLSIAVAAAAGGRVFGAINVDHRPVLYLALEDGQKRLQSRLDRLGITTGPGNLLMLPTLGATVLATIDAFLERHADERPLVILDTLGKVRGIYGGNDSYGNDYTQMSALKALVDAVPGSSLIVVHHTNKGHKDDFLDSVSGTQGLAGAADTILVIRRSRNSEDATLHVTSRDAAEGEYALTLIGGTTWQLDGNGLQQAAQRAQLRLITGGLGDDMAELIQAVSRHPEGIKPKDLKVLLTGMDGAKIDVYLKRAADEGRIAKASRGLYTPVSSVRSVRSVDPTSDTSNSSYTSTETP